MGGVRDLPLLRGATEDVGLIGVHVPTALLPDAPAGTGADAFTFIELVPWNGVVEWDVTPWGDWQMTGRNGRYEASLRATCAPDDGTVLRAPTARQGLAAVCRDTFAGRLTLCVWDRTLPPGAPPMVRASSVQAALEVGGAPWFASWKARSRMAEPLRSALRLPVDVGAVARALEPRWDPPGL